ncbi:hypothetical protein [Methylicorpusculum sp.]|uniref:hypothetical protein n=1 Tax=Methylicorpusculum sp. TaxID=2713644 RepID=UPI00271FB58D|nr:hypothetical protein [Methylicorpusculum sp.]MDO8844096.1 hypothetical protein [Methylicorpusculum sp.]
MNNDIEIEFHAINDESQVLATYEKQLAECGEEQSAGYFENLEWWRLSSFSFLRATRNQVSWIKAMPEISTLTAVSLAAVLTGCASLEQGAMPKQIITDRQAVLHVITGSKLRDQMHRVNNLMLERNMTELELDSQRRQITSRVLDVATGAESAMDCMLAGVPSLNLNAERQKLFLALADKLRNEVKTLKTQAQTHQLADIPATLDRMDTTCKSCHELFPDFTIDQASIS